MPLRAASNSGDLHAFNFGASEWAELKKSYGSIGLRMPCCNSPAIPKTSSLGNYFFAHVRKGECTSAPETAEHLYCKHLIASAAKSAGWKVCTEWMGQTPSGKEWIADVFCEHRSAKVAFEVQLSPQCRDETLIRQARYRESGVRSAWFFSARHGQSYLANRQDTPAFVLSKFEAGEEPIVEAFAVSLSAFVAGMFAKRLVWDIPEIHTTVYVEYMEDTCWKCQNPVKQVYGQFDELEPDGSQAEGWHPRSFTIASMSKALEAVLSVVSNDELSAAGLNTICERNVVRGKPTSWPYGNQCIHCGAPQDNYHVGEKLTQNFFDGFKENKQGYATYNRMSLGSGRWVFRSAE